MDVINVLDVIDIDVFVANLFSIRKIIEHLAVGIKNYMTAIKNTSLYIPFTFEFTYPYPKNELNTIKLDRTSFAKYIRFSTEIPDEIICKYLVDYRHNVEYTMQNILIILLKYYVELAYLYKAHDVSVEMVKNDTQIEYLFTNPFHRITCIKLRNQSKKYTASELVALANSVSEMNPAEIFNI